MSVWDERASVSAWCSGLVPTVASIGFHILLVTLPEIGYPNAKYFEFFF